MNGHTEENAYGRADVIRDNLARMARDPQSYTVDQFATEARVACDLLDACENRIAQLEKMVKFHQENPADAIQKLELERDRAEREVRGLVMELEIERDRIKSLKATVVNQAEHICALASMSRSADQVRQIHDARNAAGYYASEDYPQDRG